MRKTIFFLVAFFFHSICNAEINAAVSSNFMQAFEEIAYQYKAQMGVDVRASYASSGKLATQIQHGAPFDIFLSADSHFAKQVAQSKYGVASRRQTYAVGLLVLWSADELLINHNPDVLKTGHFRKLALANPKVAPYGIAANQVMHALDLWSRFEDRFVYGENIGQAFNFVHTRNAELGFVAKSQTIGQAGSGWQVPRTLYTPLDQQVVLLKRAEDNDQVNQFYQFLFSPEIRQLIQRHGYDLPSSESHE